MNDDAMEITQAELLSDFESKVVTVSPQIRRLPFDDEYLSWRDFERLIARLAMHPRGAKLVEALLYGRSGQAQDGVDVVAGNPYSKRDQVFQCKRVRAVKHGQLLVWIKKFLDGSFNGTTEVFYLCLATDIDVDIKLVNEWKACKELLAEHRIRAELWQRSYIEVILRDIPELRSGPVCLNSFPRFISGMLRTIHRRCRVVHGGGRRLRRTGRRGGQLGAHQGFHLTRPASIAANLRSTPRPA